MTEELQEQAAGEAQEVQMQIPLVSITGASIQIRIDPQTGQRMMLIGPVMLGVPLQAEAALAVAQGLNRGIVVPTAEAALNGPGRPKMAVPRSRNGR